MDNNSTVKIWKSAGHEVPYIPYTYKHVFELEKKYWDPYKVHKFIVDYWHISIPIVIGYVFLIHAIQRVMRSLKPFKLNRSLFIWNVALALFSIAGTFRTGEEFINVLRTKHSLYNTLCISYDPTGIASLWNFMFILSKIAELVDTIFIVLRKKPLIFLHWYHHAAVLIVSWHGAQMIISTSRIFIVMNFLVHSFMYSYYAVTATGRRLSRQCAMFVTTIQNIQMLGGVAATFYVAKTKWIDQEFCHVSNASLTMSFFVYLTFGLLFCRFFIDAYLRKAKRAENTIVLEEKKLN